nr:MAG TPA: hypothetical protein [Crassvirales sp.]
MENTNKIRVRGNLTLSFAYIASILLIQVKAIYLPYCRYAKLYVPLHCFKNKKVEEYGRRT